MRYFHGFLSNLLLPIPIMKYRHKSFPMERRKDAMKQQERDNEFVLIFEDTQPVKFSIQSEKERLLDYIKTHRKKK